MENDDFKRTSDNSGDQLATLVEQLNEAKSRSSDLAAKLASESETARAKHEEFEDDQERTAAELMEMQTSLSQCRSQVALASRAKEDLVSEWSSQLRANEELRAELEEMKRLAKPAQVEVSAAVAPSAAVVPAETSETSSAPDTAAPAADADVELDENGDPLPDGWSMFKSATGDSYYYNAELEKTQWEIPSDDEEDFPEDDDDEEVPPGWQKFFDNSVGQWYYYNTVTEETRWTLD
jgi:hypothetical protein